VELPARVVEGKTYEVGTLSQLTEGISGNVVHPRLDRGDQGNVSNILVIPVSYWG